jgi:phosphoglucosamine mutase
MAVRFGTDGVRGVANRAVTAELALSLGRAVARHFAATEVVIGRDTRRSGTMLEAALSAGVCAEGADAVLVGVAPTPAVAACSAEADVPGVVISASHNPFPDNGLKVFAPGGRKLDDADQTAIEQLLDGVATHDAEVPVGASVGVVRPYPGALARYATAVASTVPPGALEGLHVVLDCANGAAHEVAPLVLRRLGAQVRTLADRPDGTNINDGCGSTSPAALADAVRSAGADLGIALDGDADRVLAVDHRGELVDGDRVLVLCALDLRARGRLRNDAVAVTVMSNLGLHRALAAAGVRVVETPVGDRHVLEAIEREGLSLGGEQSGHVIFPDLSTTGDGLLCAVQLLDLVRRSGRPLADLAADAMQRVPQVLVNVAVDRPAPDVAERLASRISHARDQLGDEGRVLVRPSGTEPLVRVMVEAADPELARRVADELAADVRGLAG